MNAHRIISGKFWVVVLLLCIVLAIGCQNDLDDREIDRIVEQMVDELLDHPIQGTKSILKATIG